MAQDIQVVVREKPHDRFVREGADPDATDSLGMAPREMAP